MNSSRINPKMKKPSVIKKKKIHKGWAIFFIVIACFIIGISVGISVAYDNVISMNSQDLSNFISIMKTTGGNIGKYIVGIIEYIQSDSFNKSLPQIQSTITIAASLLGIFVAIKTLRKKE